MIVCIHEQYNQGSENQVYFVDTRKAKGVNQQEVDFIKAVYKAIKDPNGIAETSIDNMPWSANLNYLIVKPPLKVDKAIQIFYD